VPAAPQETVVRRAVVAVLTRGTLSDPAMLQSQPDPAWLLALAEAPAAGGAAQAGADDRVQIGACFLDAASGQLLLGEWCAPAPLAPTRA
jgi:DNA mismatch repair protein MSH6